MVTSAKSEPPLSLSAFRDLFNQEFQTELRNRTRDARKIDPLYGELLETMREYMERGGKRLRPYLTYVAYHGFGGDDANAIIKLGISQELYHNAWLIHDDLIDRDLRRHGGLNIAGSYRAKFAATGTPGGRHLADGLALLAGDIAATTATSLILDSPFPVQRRIAAASVQQQQNLRILSGETLDVLMPTRPASEISIPRLLQIYALKTAAYSFVAPLQIGAILAGAPAQSLPALSAFAEPLGIAFQVADDLLGMFGNEHEIGKSVLSDLREGKRTVLITTAMEIAPAADRERLHKLLGNPKAGYRHLAETRRILVDCGAQAHTEDLAEQHVQLALSALPSAGLAPAAAEALANLAQFTIHRRF